jgi:hypothetical protein
MPQQGHHGRTIMGSADVWNPSEDGEPWQDSPTARFGPLRLRHEKPYSRSYSNRSGSIFLKEYRGIDPSARQERESLAVKRAKEFGVSAPAVLVRGVTRTGRWTAFHHVRGVPGTIEDRDGMLSFVTQVLELGRRIHVPSPRGTSGAGWEIRARERHGHRTFLLDQFSRRARSQPWWHELDEALGGLHLGPAVYLHGDLKAEHFLQEEGRFSVVDWEACARGPASYDHADALFHLLRDTVYRGSNAYSVPCALAARLPVPGPVLALRLLLWLDRRPPHGPRAVDEEDVCRFLAPDTAELTRRAIHLISVARSRGVPR